MRRATELTIIATLVFAISACANDKGQEESARVVELNNTAPEVSFKSGGDDLGGAAVTPGSPYKVSYKIIGTPIVGSPVIVDLSVVSLTGSRPVDLAFRMNDESSMLLGESQPASIRMEPAAEETEFRQQVTIVPQREGRFYLNVSASFETENGTMSTITAIPIQIGTGTRELTPNGDVQTDENGEKVRVLSND